MKICAIICEYNPFHNGHLYQIQRAKIESGADVILCLMSGNFVQRGENSIMDKYTRAKHAILAGADAVLELPIIFATSNAELFAKGAIHLLSSIPEIKTLCFGAELTDKNAFLLGARYLLNEPEEVSTRIQTELARGISYAKARTNAFAELIPIDLLTSPNNILGLEYTKAILSKELDIDILPIARQGNGYHDTATNGEFLSATAIRLALENGTLLQRAVPPFVLPDLPSSTKNILDSLEKYAVLTNPAKKIAQVCDCTEGLENAFKKVATSENSFVETLTSARYTASRIRRIALHNLLNIEETLIRSCLDIPLYIKPLAIKANHTELLSILGNGKFPFVLRAHDEDVLDGLAKQCFEKEQFADKIYQLLHTIQPVKNIFIS